MELVSLADVRSAAELVAPAVVRTPLLACPWAGELLVKPESLQPVGSFKLRGAYHALARLGEAERSRGVVAYSSGNHAQAVAYAAARFGVPAVIVVDDSAPARKVAATRSHGAEVVSVPLEEREAVAERIAGERGATMIPPFDAPEVIAGQGTIGLEIVADAPNVATVLVPISGGGLASGIGVAVKALRPAARVVGVEPELAADTKEGLAAGHRVSWTADDRRRTISDGLRAQPSELTFAHLTEVLDDVLTVTEDETRAAVRQLALQTRIVTEPSGAVTAAAWLRYRDTLPSGPAVAVASGGNVDPAMLAGILG